MIRKILACVLGAFLEPGGIIFSCFLLESFLDGFNDESTQVQLQLLTAIVKLFLKKPNDYDNKPTFSP